MTIGLRLPGARALIAPLHGGRLHQLFVDLGGVETPLLYSPHNPEDYRGDPLIGGCYPMAPWPNRINGGSFEWRGSRVVVANGREHALHGLVADQPWEVVARVGRVVEMTCDLGAGWPWEGKAWQRLELGPNFLAMKMEVRSAREAFPAGCGWHPWFRRDVAGSGDVSVTANARKRYILERGLPSGELVDIEGQFALDGSPLGDRRLDDCYTGFAAPAEAIIEWERLRLSMSFQSPTLHLQVYTPAGAVCIEPQTCAPDAFNLSGRGSSAGAAVVEPGRALSLTTRWTWLAR